MEQRRLEALLGALARRAGALSATDEIVPHGLFVFDEGYSLRSGVCFDPPSQASAARRLREILGDRIADRRSSGWVLMAPAPRGRMLCLHLCARTARNVVRAAFSLEDHSEARMISALRRDESLGERASGDLSALVPFNADEWLDRLADDAARSICVVPFRRHEDHFRQVGAVEPSREGMSTMTTFGMMSAAPATAGVSFSSCLGLGLVGACTVLTLALMIGRALLRDLARDAADHRTGSVGNIGPSASQTVDVRRV